MKSKWLVPGIIVAVIAVLGLWIGGTYNSLVQQRETVVTSFGNLQTQYQRRADLIPNLVNTVKGSSNFEQETLNQVVSARAKATGISVDASTATPEQMQSYIDAQNGVTSSLSKLLAVVESYPDIKSTAAYQDLMSQLEGTENRIQVARSDFNNTARPYNARLQTFPTNLIAGLFGFTQRPYFQADAGSEAAPTVQFDNTTTAQ
ncbi:MAG: LemA family protein [Candidatus Saccharibacteria bacterium]|jgi:LemA protein|nr:LemA family protein [Candidatus Saccharibacteria bacterium]MCA9336695.1 LemA family protein [Candidatus Saccharibacteria bacterium]MCA9340326.1 LemA family protein [Candidatus Saccharibacteria bacterium]